MMFTSLLQVRTASCGATACVNSFGDEQLAVDLLADKLLFEALRFSHVCKWACSEEVPEPVDMEGMPTYPFLLTILLFSLSPRLSCRPPSPPPKWAVDMEGMPTYPCC